MDKQEAPIDKHCREAAEHIAFYLTPEIEQMPPEEIQALAAIIKHHIKKIVAF